MKTKVLLAVICLLIAGGLRADASPGNPTDPTESSTQVVGEEVFESYGSPNPYVGLSDQNEAQLIWSDVIHYPGASYICPHFGRMDLGKGDFVIVRSPDHSRSWRYEHNGTGDLGTSDQGFWSIHIGGDTAVVELWSGGDDGGFGYAIDRFARGFSQEEVEGPFAIEGIVGTDDSEWAPCYESSDPVIYNKSRAVARMLTNGMFACTGWLVGSEGHLLTNNHCIANQSEASNTNFEFMAEGATCATGCASWFGCPGSIVATSSTLISTLDDYDYAVVQLPVNPSATYGYFTLRESGGVVGERLYIPQHPAGWGKKIALYSSAPADPGYPQVVSKNYSGCGGRPGPDMGYRADTQGGSSGAPVVSYDDHQIIALHHCGSSTINTGVLIEQVIAEAGADLPASAFGIAGLIFQDGFESNDTGFWNSVVP